MDTIWWFAVNRYNHQPSIKSLWNNLWILSALVAPAMNHRKSLSNEGRSFSRSDIILESQEWSNNIIAKINEEHDCDSSNEAIRIHSQNMISRELDFADHVITYGFTLVKLTGSNKTNLARILSSKQIKGLLYYKNYRCDAKSVRLVGFRSIFDWNSNGKSTKSDWWAAVRFGW